MAVSMDWYEVSVSVPIKGSRHYSSHGQKSTMQNIGAFIQRTVVKTFHKEAKTPKQAMQLCAKYGHPISARKTDVCERDNIENLQLLPENPYPNAIAMSDMIWQRKSKRAERLYNSGLDKPIID